MNCPIHRCLSLLRDRPQCTDYASIEKSRFGAETDIVDWGSFEENRQKMVHICNVGRLAINDRYRLGLLTLPCFP